MWYKRVGDTYITTEDIVLLRDFDYTIFGYKNNVVINHYSIISKYIKIINDQIYILKGSPWNGSNMSKDTNGCMLASLVHDLICHYLNNNDTGLYDEYRLAADKLYLDMILRGGMNKFRAYSRYYSIRTYVNFKKWF